MSILAESEEEKQSHFQKYWSHITATFYFVFQINNSHGDQETEKGRKGLCAHGEVDLHKGAVYQLCFQNYQLWFSDPSDHVSFIWQILPTASSDVWEWGQSGSSFWKNIYPHQ